MGERLGSRRSRAAWWTFGAVLGLVVLFVVFEFLGTFVFGVFLYYATRPVAELRDLSETVDLGPLADLVGEYPDLSGIAASPGELIQNGGADVVLGIASSATGFLGLFGLFALHLFVMFAVAFYLLRDDHRLSSWIGTNLSDDPGVLDAYLDAVDEDLHSIFFGNILNAAITGTIGAITYSLLNLFASPGLSVPYAVLVGLLTGVASLIPIVGMKLVYVPVSVYLFARLIPDLVLRPYISGRNLHVGMVMMAYVLGPLLFGWYGIFLAPLLLVLAFHFARIILPELVAGDPITPGVTGRPTVEAGPDGPAGATVADAGTGEPADGTTTDGGGDDPANEDGESAEDASDGE
ncbi:AI-2E family transporter [Halobacteriales archaeon QS_1_68_20]|nr:MAG: AI-2E family transporter [Halobacteriales archaeon QS_1_68_20]